MCQQLAQQRWKKIKIYTHMAMNERYGLQLGKVFFSLALPVSGYVGIFGKLPNLEDL